MAQQTPKQRAANAKYARKIEKQHGKKKVEKSGFNFPISTTWVLVLAFLICGGAVLEILRLIF